MPFQRMLESLRASLGAAGAVMVDNDGEVVASAPGPENSDMELVGAHLSLILARVKEAGSMVAGEQVKTGSIVISTAGARLVIIPLKEDYCLVILLKRRASAARAVFEAARTAEEIEREMG